MFLYSGLRVVDAVIVRLWEVPWTYRVGWVVP
jgi:hypothetical protein